MADVVVLGADGFIGSHLCDALLGRGLSVRAFDRFPGGVARFTETRDGLELLAGDFLKPEDLAEAVDGVPFVVHLVSTTTPASSSANPIFDVDTNVRGTVAMLETCVTAGVERVMFASTGGAIYGRDLDRPLREDDMVAPISPYAVGKLAIEGYLRYFRHSRGLDSVTLRISNPYGERQSPLGAQGAIPIFLRLMMEGSPITVFGDGSMVRDYIYVHDLARIMAEMLDRPLRHRLYNIGSGTGMSVTELIAMLERATGMEAIVGHLPYRPTDVHRVVLDTARYVEEFGTPRLTPMDDGIRVTADYVRDRVIASGARS